MDREILDMLGIFEIKDDAVLREIRIWRTTIFSITEAQRIYAEQMLEAMRVMESFLEEEAQHKIIGQSSAKVMVQLQDIVTAITSLHSQIWAKFCYSDGPYMKLMELEDDGCQLLKEKAAENLRKHQVLEELANAEKNLYQTYLAKWIPSHRELSRIMSKKEMSQDEGFSSLTGKVDVALTKYQSHFRRESKHRKILAKQNEEIKERFFKQEMERLESLYETLNEFLATMKKIIPIATEGVDQLNFTTGEVDVEDLAQMSLEAHLIPYTFQEYEGPSGTDPSGPPQPILQKGDFKEKKPGPVSLFTVVSKDNFFPESGTKKTSSKMVKSESSFTSPIQLLRKQSSSTSPAPEDGQEEDSDSEMCESEGPNLKPLDTFEEMPEDAGRKIAEKKRSTAKKEKINRPMNDLSSNETSGSESSQIHDVLQRIWDTEKGGPAWSLYDKPASAPQIIPKDKKHVGMSGSSKKSETFAKLSEDCGKPSGVSNRISPGDRPTKKHSLKSLRGYFRKERSYCSSENVSERRSDSQGSSSEDTKRSRVIGYKLAKKNSGKTSKKQSRTNSSEQTIKAGQSTTRSETVKEITVLALKDRLKENADEISLRAGMKIKQTSPANENGMAYGYKKNKVGIKKYGFYPAKLVAAYSVRTCSSETPEMDEENSS